MYIENLDFLTPLYKSVCKNQLKLQITVITWSVQNFDTTIQISSQKLAKIEHAQDRGFRISDIPIQPCLQKLAKIENLWDRGFRISDTPIQPSLKKLAKI